MKFDRKDLFAGGRIDVFYEIPCLTERSSLLRGSELIKRWFKSADKRNLVQVLQKFITYNSDLLSFLGVQSTLSGSDSNISLAFRSTSYIGAVPLRAPDTGKQIGDFVVSPRFTGRDRFEDYIEILDLLGSEISPEVIDSLPLASGRNFRPPLYLEAVKFIASLEQLLTRPWRKFDNLELVLNNPWGQVNWNKYAAHEFRVENRIKFPVRKNILSEFHREYSEIRFVFDICQNELMSSNTPQRIKNTLRSRLSFIESKLYLHKPISTSNILIRSADSPTIRLCKERANRILNYDFVDSTAWRVDFNDVFEKFVQYVFKEVAKESGGRLYPNYKFHSRTSGHYSWELKHVEPDAVYQNEDFLLFVDAKYKSNLYNKFSDSEFLKDEHRHDIHQIMAYSSFSKSDSKFGCLCYPCDKFESKSITFLSGISSTSNTILVCGIPLRKEAIQEVKAELTTRLSRLRVSATQAAL